MKQLIAEDLLKIKAVFLRPNEPFTWASGIRVLSIVTTVSPSATPKCATM